VTINFHYLWEGFGALTMIVVVAFAAILFGNWLFDCGMSQQKALELSAFYSAIRFCIYLIATYWDLK